MTRLLTFLRDLLADAVRLFEEATIPPQDKP